MSILIDAHIHIQPSVSIDRLLDAAWKNFSKVHHKLSPDTQSSYVLMLAEGKENDIFSELFKKTHEAMAKSSSKWAFHATNESNSIACQHEDKKITIIAGRQLISSEKLELLSLFSPKIFPDNKYSLEELARRVTNEGGIPLLAWGVGKWLGKRGKIIRDFQEHPPVPVYFVGDNGNRPFFWPYPTLLKSSEQQGILSLPGSDPLSMANHEERAGSFGVYIDGKSLPKDNPGETLKKILLNSPHTHSFGRRAGLFQFFSDQLRANLQKRL